MNPDFEKGNGLIPVVIQDFFSSEVLMLGYMNKEALEKTQKESKVTFFSRSKGRLWTKGEQSGNFLWVKEILEDCDKDTLLIKVIPEGPVCHKGTHSCFGEMESKGFIYKLENIIDTRVRAEDTESYTYRLFSQGINKIAQKVGEEAVETIIEAKDDNDELFINETADLLYHLLVLLRYKKLSLTGIEEILQKRHK